MHVKQYLSKKYNIKKFCKNFVFSKNFSVKNWKFITWKMDIINGVVQKKKKLQQTTARRERRTSISEWSSVKYYRLNLGRSLLFLWKDAQKWRAVCWNSANFKILRSRLSHSKINRCVKNKIELPNFELSSWSRSELLVSISSINLSSEVSWNIFVSVPWKKYSISMNYQNLITSGNEQLQAMA